MSSLAIKRTGGLLALAAAVVIGLAGAAPAAIQGVNGPVFDFTAKAGHIQTPDGNSIYMWGLAVNGGTMQYPAPTLILAEGQPVILTLTNQLTVPVSLVFPGQGAVTSLGGVPGLITAEAPPGGSVTYAFTPANPGTFTYYSGTRSDLQVEMGLLGAIVVRPTTNPGTQAYNDPDSTFDHEYLFLLTELDPVIHAAAETGRLATVDTTKFFPVYWLINGRAAPDTMADADVPWLPSQPYNCMPQMHPGETVLMRIVGGGRDLHPFHTHGNHHQTIARNGRLLSSTGSGADLSQLAFTSSVLPGQTIDALFTWSGAGLGWDVYGHTDPTATGQVGAFCTAAPEPGEDIANHCKTIPVVLPEQQSLAFGFWYSGSPFLGSSVPLPPGEGGLNPNAGYFFMFHSHNEKEITNFDIFPGGMMTMMDVEPPGVPLVNP
jgi:FtsP/CotA-like multicopper oxidase with cupredoxin domain